MMMWNDWFDRLGGHLVDRGNPVFARADARPQWAGTVLGGCTLSPPRTFLPP